MDNILDRYREIADQIEATINAYHNRSISWFVRVFRWLFITWWSQEPIFVEHLKSFKSLYEEAQQSLVHASKEDTSVLLNYDCQLAGSVFKIIRLNESFIIRAISAQVEDLLKKVKDWQEDRVVRLKNGFLDNRRDSFHSEVSTGSSEYLYSPGSELTEDQEVYGTLEMQEETQEERYSSHWASSPFFRPRSSDPPLSNYQLSMVNYRTVADSLASYRAESPPIDAQYHLKK